MRTLVVIAASSLFGFALAVVGVDAVQAHDNAVVSTADNDSGETYGSAASVHSVAQEPDLILVTATNGKTGYVKKADLEPGSSLKTPQDALALTKANEAGRLVKVYSSDGKTVIGEFEIGGRTSLSTQTRK